MIRKIAAAIQVALRFLVILPILPFNGDVEEEMAGPLAKHRYGAYYERGKGMKFAFGRTTFIAHRPGKWGRR